jgi:hypothetical protein
MSVKYNVIECKNLLAKLAAPKFYASAKADGEISLKTIKLQKTAPSISDTDVLAVLNDLTRVFIRHLLENDVVKLSDILRTFK